MPQHPRYTNSPSRNLDKLYSLLDQLEGFGLVHEEIHQNLDSIMSELYPSEVKKYAAYERGDEFSTEENEGREARRDGCDVEDRPRDGSWACNAIVAHFRAEEGL